MEATNVDRARILLIAGLSGRDPRTVRKVLADPASVRPMAREAVLRAQREAENFDSHGPQAA